MPGQYQFPEGFHMVRLYPMEGESAVAELWFGEAPWASLELRGVNQDAVGEARVADIRLIVSLYPPPRSSDRRGWEFDLEQVRQQLDSAQEWLLDNKRQRLPVEGEGWTAAGRAFDKMAPADQERWLDSPDSG